jgi:hypothetical protein
MKYDVTHILTSLKNECQRYGKRHVEIRKMEKKTQIYLLQLDSVFKKTNGQIRNISVIQHILLWI